MCLAIRDARQAKETHTARDEITLRVLTLKFNSDTRNEKKRANERE